MLKIRIIQIGKTETGFLQSGVDYYQKKIKPLASLEIITLKKHPQSDPQEEGKKIASTIDPSAFIVLMDEKGKQFNSREFSELIDQKKLEGFSKIDFVIGGSYGLSEEIKNNHYLILSYSKFTTTHQLIRLCLLEQIYRVLNISNKTGYHH